MAKIKPEFSKNTKISSHRSCFCACDKGLGFTTLSRLYKNNPHLGIKEPFTHIPPGGFHVKTFSVMISLSVNAHD